MLHSWPEGVAGIRIKRLGWAGNPSVPLETETAIVNHQDQTGMSRTRTVFDRLSGPIQGFSTVITPSHLSRGQSRCGYPPPTSYAHSKSAENRHSTQQQVTQPAGLLDHQRSFAAGALPAPAAHLSGRTLGLRPTALRASPYTQHTLTHDVCY